MYKICNYWVTHPAFEFQSLLSWKISCWMHKQWSLFLSFLAPPKFPCVNDWCRTAPVIDVLPLFTYKTALSQQDLGHITD